MQRETEDWIGEEMGQGEPRDVPAEASGMPLSFFSLWVIGWVGWVAAVAVVGTDKYFQDFYRIYFTEKHLEKWWDLYLIPKGLHNP